MRELADLAKKSRKENQESNPRVKTERRKKTERVNRGDEKV